MMFLQALLGSLVVLPLVDTAARILISKEPLSRFSINGGQFVVKYDIYNFGDKAATQVVLDDTAAFPKEHFIVQKGANLVKFHTLLPGENVTHSVIVTPVGLENFKDLPAKVQYLDGSSSIVRQSTSTTLGNYYVYDQKTIDRFLKPEAPKVFMIFGTIVGSTTAMFYLLACRYAQKYQNKNEKAKK